MLKEVFAYALRKAFTDDVRSRDFSQSILVSSTEPASGAGDGTVNFPDGALGATRIFIAPYCGSGPGTPFSLRVWGWKRMGPAGEADTEWWPFPLVELNCVTGPVAGLSDRFGKPLIVSGHEYTCDTITVATTEDGLPKGSLGLGGEIGGWPGCGAAVFAVVETRGAMKVTLDPRQDNALPVNAMWALV